MKSSLTVEAWKNDKYCLQPKDDEIDNFKIALSSPLDKFNLSNSLTFQGYHRVGNLTLSYGNLTNPTSCSSDVQPTFSTNLYTPQGNSYQQIFFQMIQILCFYNFTQFAVMTQTLGIVILY